MDKWINNANIVKHYTSINSSKDSPSVVEMVLLKYSKSQIIRNNMSIYSQIIKVNKQKSSNKISEITIVQMPFVAQDVVYLDRKVKNSGYKD